MTDTMELLNMMSACASTYRCRSGHYCNVSTFTCLPNVT